MYEFDKCILTSDHETVLGEGYINEYQQDVMNLTLSGGFRPAPEDSVFLYIYDQVKGECKYSARVEEILMDRVTLRDLSLIRSLQKRDNTRAEKILRYRITERYTGVGLVPLEKPVDITIVNISATGMCFNSDEKFRTGFTFSLEFRETTRPIELKIRIIRAEQFSHSNRYGCVFEDISDREKDEIFRFVLREQIEQRRKRLRYE